MEVIALICFGSFAAMLAKVVRDDQPAPPAHASRTPEDLEVVTEEAIVVPGLNYGDLDA